MKLAPIFKISLTSLKNNKVRTSLTVLGIVIGIASVIVVFSAGEGISSLIVGQIESFGGSDMIETEIKVPSTKKGSAGDTQSATAMVQGVQITTLSLEDMEDINKLPNVKESYAGIMGQEQVNYGSETKKAMIMGVSASFVDMDDSEIEYGNFFTDAEDKSLSKVVVLGYKMKEKLFGNSDPLGKFIKIRKTKFRVIGVMKERGAVMTMDFDDMVYVPVRTLQKRVMGIDHVLYMMHRVYDTTIIKETAEDIRVVIRENHDLDSIPIDPKVSVVTIGEYMTDTSKDDFRVVTMTESLEIMSVVTGAITLLLLAIVAVSLVVGGVGILNIMYVVVTERTAEIGLRKAVGAKYADIMIQFLIEAVLITIVGGVVGIIIGSLLSAVIAFGANSYGLEWDFVIPFKSIVVALGFSAFFGLVFGIYPARKAARMDPIAALRNE